MDWNGWHADYDLPESPLAQRLRVVQEQVRLALDACPPGPLRVVSMCAGQGRDLIDVLRDHPRRGDVTARLVELDPRNVAAAQQAAQSADLHQVEVVLGDASLISQYQGMVPADLVLACGIFGNISDEDIERTVSHFSQLCGAGAMLVWTRHRRPPDQVPQICDWLEEHGFAKHWLSEPDVGFGVGVHRFTGETEPLVLESRMFSFR